MLLAFETKIIVCFREVIFSRTVFLLNSLKYNWFAHETSGNSFQRTKTEFIIFCIFLVIMSNFRDLLSVFKASTFLECLVSALQIMLRYMCLLNKTSRFV